MKPRAKLERNIYLIGFMACGKTTVGRALAKRLGRRFIDSDLALARAERRSAGRVFSEDGEAAFRRLEARTIARIARGRGAVAALGGGAILRPGTVRLIRRSGVVVYLSVPLAALFARGERSERGVRPLWSGATRQARLAAIRKLLAARLPLYRRSAHLILRADKDAPRAIASRIARGLQDYQLSPLPPHPSPLPPLRGGRGGIGARRGGGRGRGKARVRGA